MQNMSIYHIEVAGKMNENTFNATSPLQITMVQVEQEVSLFTICADQSGLIGLLRYLHGRGFVLLSCIRKEKASLLNLNRPRFLPIDKENFSNE